VTAPDFRTVLGLRSVLGAPPGRDSTRSDHFEYLEEGFTPLACGHCGAVVRVKKNSPKHTSIQWSRSAERTCPFLSAAAADGSPVEVVQGCDRLREEIAAAAQDGRLHTGDSGINRET
jgi:hypothetical protein